MKNKCFLFIMLLLPFLATAERIYTSIDKEIPFINYTATSNQSLAIIAGKFNIAAGELAAYNQIEQSSVLSKGSSIKVPVSHVLTSTCEKECVEVFYQVQPSEGLYRIGKNFGYQNTNTLKKLNNLRSDVLSKGQVLMVGYISKNLFNYTENTGNTTSSIIQETVVKEPVTKETVNQPAFKTISTEKETTDTVDLINMQYAGEGFFKPEFKQGQQQTEMTASTFKTETGWRDGKFYVLVDKIETGKVIRIKNSLTGTFIYAKVLSELPHIGKKDLVKIRLSSAAAIALGFTEDQLFTVEISY